MMRWWCDKGVDGWRMDVISMIGKENFNDGPVAPGALYGSFEPSCQHTETTHRYLQEMRREAGGYIRGQLLVALAVGLLTALGLLIVGIPAWLVLGLLMGACEFIPYIGPLIGGVPIALFSLPMGFHALLWGLGVTVLVQQIEGYFLSPRLMGEATGLHPVSVLLLLSAGGLLFGLGGMMAAVPAYVCLRGAVRVLWETGE